MWPVEPSSRTNVGSPVGRAADGTDGFQNGVDLVAREVLVFRGEGVDRWRHDQCPAGIEVFPDVGGAGEDVAVRLRYERAQKVPHFVRLAVGIVGSDVAAPDHAEPGGPHRRHEPRGLGIVKNHDIARPGQCPQLERVGLQRGAVHLPRRGVEAAAVAGVAVEHVVDALGDREELTEPWRRGDHGPADVGAGAARVCHQRTEHFGHTAAGGGRVHIPDCTAAQGSDALAQRAAEGAPDLSPEHVTELGRIAGGDRDCLYVLHSNPAWWPSLM